MFLSHAAAPRLPALILALGAGGALAGEDTLRAGESLAPGRALVSRNGFHHLSFDLWGRPLLWARGQGQFRYFEVPLWVAPVAPGRRGPGRLILEPGNDLVLYGPDGAVRWRTGTAGQGAEPAVLTVTDEGELCLASGDQCLWRSRPNIRWERERPAPGRDPAGRGRPGWCRALRSLLGLAAAVLPWPPA